MPQPVDSGESDSESDGIHDKDGAVWNHGRHRCDGSVRALVYPLSPAARLACKPEREQVPDCEKDDPVAGSPTTGIFSLRNCEHRNCMPCFSLGISPACHVTFDYEEESWTPQVHALIYPDPDGDDAELYNPTLQKTLSVTEAGEGKIYHVAPGKHFRLQAGRSWAIQVTPAHKFGLLLPPASELYNTLLSEHVLGGSEKVFLLPIARDVCEVKSKPPARETTLLEACTTIPGRRIVKLATPEPDCSDTEADDASQSITSPSPDRDETLFENARTTVRLLKRDGRLVVLKKPRDASLWYAGRQWTTERDVLSRLSHPHIIRLIEWNPHDLSLQLEYGGRSLADLVNATDQFAVARSLDDVQARIWLHTALALDYLHSTKAVMHCDIKPQNILLSNDHSVVKLCDFGLARAADSRDRGGGTPHFIAPELMLNRKRTPAADIWALGVTMLFVLNLIPLPNGGSWRISRLKDDELTQQKMREWLSEVAEARERIPEKWALMRDMLHPNYKKRITARDLVERLQAMEVVKLAGKPMLAMA